MSDEILNSMGALPEAPTTLSKCFFIRFSFSYDSVSNILGGYCDRKIFAAFVFLFIPFFCRTMSAYIQRDEDLGLPKRPSILRHIFYYRFVGS